MVQIENQNKLMLGGFICEGTNQLQDLEDFVTWLNVNYYECSEMYDEKVMVMSNSTRKRAHEEYIGVLFEKRHDWRKSGAEEKVVESVARNMGNFQEETL